jgi:type IV pilus assembly protein PilV
MSRIRHPMSARRAQGGSFLLEALISVLIVAFGILGIIGLQARVIQNVNDSSYRGEAVYLANSLMAQMWTSDPATLVAKFGTGAPAGTPYDEFKKMIGIRLPGGNLPGNDPLVAIVPPAGLNTGTSVTITIFWQPPGEPTRHNYVSTAIIATN